MIIDLLDVLEADEGREPQLCLLSEILRAILLEEFFKLIIISCQILIADPMQVIGALKLLNENLLVKAHMNELLNCVTNKGIVHKLAVTVLPDLLENGLTKFNQPFSVDAVPENLQ